MVNIIDIHARLKTISEIANLVNADFKLRDGKIIEWSEGNPPTEEEIQTKLSELKNAEPMRLLRQERNQKLQETDWRFRSDLTPSQEWIDYSQALRDLPATFSPVLDILMENDDRILKEQTDWPTKPA